MLAAAAAAAVAHVCRLPAQLADCLRAPVFCMCMPLTAKERIMQTIHACRHSTMARRVQYSCHGDSSVLQLVTDQPVPARKAGQVLIDNHATSTNPVDYKVRREEVEWCFVAGQPQFGEPCGGRWVTRG